MDKMHCCFSTARCLRERATLLRYTYIICLCYMILAHIHHNIDQDLDSLHRL